MGRHFVRAQMLFDLRRYYEAVDAFSYELEENPQNDLALSLRGAALLNLGYSGSAEDDVRSAISLNPEEAYHFYLLSAIHVTRRELASAEEAILEALRLESDPRWFQQLAAILFERNRFKECVDTTQQALRLAPNDEESLILRAKALTSLGRAREAQELLFAALAISPESPAAHHAVGKLELQAGQPSESLSYLTEARRLDPIEFNDRESIARAYGRGLMPYRLIDRWILRWHDWTPKRRWALFTVVGTLALAHALSFMYSSGYEVGWAFYCYVAFVNWCAFSITYRELTTTAAILDIGRELDLPVSAQLSAAWACLIKFCWIHVFFGAILAFAALFAPLSFVVYGAISLYDLFRDFLQINSILRGFWYLAVGFVFLVLVFCGAMASVQDPILTIAFWALLVAAAYFNTNISHWIMRPRVVNLRSSE